MIAENFEIIPTINTKRQIELVNDAQYSLLCFCDASISAYTASVYIHQEKVNGNQTDLVFAK